MRKRIIAAISAMLSIFVFLTFLHTPVTSASKKQNEIDENGQKRYELRRMNQRCCTVEKKLRATLFKQDKPLYNKILWVIIKMIQPYYEEKRPHGGVLRASYADNMIQELVEIHNSKEYGSAEKRSCLNELLNTARKKLDELNLMDRSDVSSNVRQPYIFSSINLLDNRIKTSTVGGNISAGVIVGLGCGFSVGKAKLPWGARQLVIVGQGTRSVLAFAGISVSVGRYVFRNQVNKCEGKVIRVDSDDKSFALLLAGGSYAVESDCQITEGELGVFLITRMFKDWAFRVVRFSKLPTDYSYFRKNLGLTEASGLLPKSCLENE